MLIHLICVGKHMPDWIQSGFQTYADRMPADYRINLIEISAEKRTKHANLQKIAENEVAKIKKQLPDNALCITLDRLGKTLTTKQLSNSLKEWHDLNQDIALIVGGPEGLPESFIKEAHKVWSLSDLTLPHPLVRVMLAEQLYRAWSIIVNHPYHR